MPTVPVSRKTQPIIPDPLRRDIVPRRRTPPANDREAVAPQPVPQAEPVAQETPVREVGKGHPPIEHQFKPGQSGNPKGRPKGAKGVTTIVRAILDTKQTVIIGGEEMQMTLREALIRKRLERAMTKSEHSADYLLNKDQAGEPATDVASSQVPPIDDAVNQAIIDAFLAMIKMGEPIQSDTKGGDHEQA